MIMERATRARKEDRMSEKVIGTCSNCGGDVVAHEIQYSVRPMPPTCRSCGATPRSPVLDMGPPARWGQGRPQERGGPDDR
jgi:hypothetical protein